MRQMARGRTVRRTLDCLIAAVAAEHALLIFHQDRDFEYLHEYAGVKTYDANAPGTSPHRTKYRWNPR